MLSSSHRKAVGDNFFTLNETHPSLLKQLEVHFMSCVTSKHAIGSTFKRCLRRWEKFRTIIFPLAVSSVSCFMVWHKVMPYNIVNAKFKKSLIAFILNFTAVCAEMTGFVKAGYRHLNHNAINNACIVLTGCQTLHSDACGQQLSSQPPLSFYCIREYEIKAMPQRLFALFVLCLVTGVLYRTHSSKQSACFAVSIIRRLLISY